MIKQGEVKIYKSDRRENVVTPAFKVFSTFGFGASHDCFGKLQVFNQEILAPAKSIKHNNFENQEVVLIPLVGAIDIDFGDKSRFVHIEQLSAFHTQRLDCFEVKNPYESEFVSYLQIRFPENQVRKEILKDFQLDRKNQLFALLESEMYSIAIGSFEGRKEGTYTLRNSENKLFVFVINGAFEVENRLVETGDGLSFDHIDKTGFEALSENAIIMIVETQ